MNLSYCLRTCIKHVEIIEINLFRLIRSLSTPSKEEKDMTNESCTVTFSGGRSITLNSWFGPGICDCKKNTNIFWDVLIAQCTLNPRGRKWKRNYWCLGCTNPEEASFHQCLRRQTRKSLQYYSCDYL
jgi:hypothetical protein